MCSNVYGTHPFYLETRYFTQHPDGSLSPVETHENSPKENYTSFSHGVYLRNAHGQDILLESDSITYRAIGGMIDLYFFQGPTQPEVTSSYLKAVGLPALQQYWTFGFHQCRWGYKSWSDLQDVVDNHVKFEIPLETVWYVFKSHHSVADSTDQIQGLILTGCSATEISITTLTASTMHQEIRSSNASMTAADTMFQSLMQPFTFQTHRTLVMRKCSVNL